ncbi:hypothetical protein [Paraliomyxa miuraensis]|uniref:hypothetical protein n=1 Tax=Paraliomyxa miuraensis TaxID=376150 RepID=UPI0022590C67|nr:hypothetical protein [Paraliomyxa miuraensis]MCX4246740.1 hypothetical protein [Paraliomyxa miuraensis]
MLLGVVGAVGGGSSVMAMAMPPQDPGPREAGSRSLGQSLDGALRIEVDGERREHHVGAGQLPERIRAQHPDVADGLRRTDGHEQWIYVWIGGEPDDYFVSVIPVRDGAAFGAPVESFRCACDDETLIEALHERIDAAVASLRGDGMSGSAGTEQGEPVRQEEEAERPSPGRVPVDDRGGHRRMGPRGYVGLGVGTLGAGALVAGIVLTRQPEQTRGQEGTFEHRSLRNAGIGVAVAGGVALATGVTLLVADLVGARRRSLAIAPVLDGRQVGLSVARGF